MLMVAKTVPPKSGEVITISPPAARLTITTTAPKVANRNEQKAALNRARVAACGGRGEGKRIGDMIYGGEWLTLMVRLRKATGDLRYLSEAEANSYAPDPAGRKAYNAALRRSNTALADDILSGRIELKLNF